MRAEDILYEAEKLKLRKQVFKAVNKLKENNPYMPLDTVYEVAWEQVKRENIKE